MTLRPSGPTPPADDWSRLKAVFLDALALAPSARPEFVEHMCPDLASQQRVHELLSAHARVGGFLESSTPVLSEGRRLGPYVLGTRIGRGGMGDVYRATDSRIDRAVALKVLAWPSPLAGALRDTLVDEARAIGALNHPHICTLHDVGHAEGLDFLVLELLDGETLASRLARGRLSWQTSLVYGTQMASALAAVHRAGLVHGDVTPANVFVTPKGVKVLDFGLTRRLPSSAPTIGDDQAGVGPRVGTPGYLAPEVLSGEPATPVSDIFALGVVLHEMLLGRPGEALDHDHAATAESPRDSIQGDAPQHVLRLVRMCLARSPGDRWQSAADLHLALQWAETPVHHRPPVTRWARAATWVGAALVMALAGAAALGLRDRGRNTGPVVKFDITTAPTSEPTSFALSPDGAQLAFVATSNGASVLWTRALDQREARALAGTEGAAHPFWSPDGRTVAFFADGMLKRLDLSDAKPVAIADAPNGRGGSWSRDGTIIYAPSTAGSLLLVPAGGGLVRPVTQLSTGESSHRWPQFLDDGRHFLYLSTQGAAGAPGLYLGSLDGAPSRRLADTDASGALIGNSRLIYVRNGALVLAGVDIGRAAVLDDGVVLETVVGVDPTLSKAAFSASASGVLAVRASLAERRQLLLADREGRSVALVGPPDDAGLAAPELSSDERRVAVFRTVGSNTDTWLVDAATGVVSRHSYGTLPEMFPVWSPNADLIFTSVRSNGYFLTARAADGSGDDRALLPQSQLAVPTSLAPDGRLLIFAVQRPGTGVDLWALHLGDNRPPAPLIATPFDEMAGQISPNGQWFAYQSNSSGRMEIYVTALASPENARQVSPAGGAQPRWSRSGNELFYVARDSAMTAVPLTAPTDGALDIGVPRALFPVALATGFNVPPAVGQRPQYDVTRDGRFLLNTAVPGSAPVIAVTVGLDQTRP